MTTIVVEGVDNSGKTTIALKLVKRLKGIYLKTEFIPPERESLAQYATIIEAATYYGNGIVISDRHAAVSDPIYGPIVRGWTKLEWDEVLVQIANVEAFVYCRPSDDVIMRTISTREQMAGVVKNTHALIQAYDAFFGELESRTARVWRYDYTKDDTEVLAREIHKYARLP